MSCDEREALNRTLFRRMVGTFGNVLIKHKGEAQTYRRSIDMKTGERIKVVDNAGEAYAVCCPECNDTRFRCNINHMYGTDDKNGRPRTHLVYCFNAGCPLCTESEASAARDRIERLLLSKHFTDLRKAHIKVGKKVDLDKIRTDWPGQVTRLDKLPEDHKAVRYLRDDRHFDVGVLARYYNLHWCYKSDRSMCEDRIIIPIYANKRMVGWQARYPGDLDWKNCYFPKYYTAPGTPRRNILYNLGNASKYKTGVIVEGVTDVYGIGPMSVGTLGAVMTSPQQDLFVRHFKGETGVLLYDPDADGKKSTVELVESLRARLDGNFCQVKLPEGVDPGSLDRRFSRNYIAKEAKKQGVIVSWLKR